MSESRSIYLAALLSLLLHAMLLVIGTGHNTERTMAMALSDNQGVMARLDGEAGEISVLLVSADGEASTASPDTSFDFETDDGRLTSAALAVVTEPFSKPKSPNDPSDAADNTPTSPPGASKPLRHSIPLDDYSAQIMGRIERAWVRPLTHLEGAFRCEVRISQTPQGEVREVTLTQCDGDAAWRQSITRAIRYASPLPAPPSEKAFHAVLTLNFQAEPMSPALLASLLSVSEELGLIEHPSAINHPTAGGTPIGDSRAVNPRAR